MIDQLVLAQFLVGKVMDSFFLQAVHQAKALRHSPSSPNVRQRTSGSAKYYAEKVKKIEFHEHIFYLQRIKGVQ